MTTHARQIQRTYLALTLVSTLAWSLIWGINTLFLLDAGLSATAAFGVNACFSAGQVIFEVPTGVIADTWGRRASYLIGSLVLAVATALYWLAWLVHGPFWAWGVVSLLLGLGFTCFSGATDAWLVDALRHAGFTGRLEGVFGKGQVVAGAATLVGSVSGGLLAQWFDLGVPYLVRSVGLVATFGLAFAAMRDWGFTPKIGERPLGEVRHLLRASVRHGFGNPPVRWSMLAAVFSSGIGGAFSGGVGLYAYYAMQPYLLELHGNRSAYGIAGLAAAIVAVAQVAGGFAAPGLRRRFRRGASALLAAGVASAGLLCLLGVAPTFAVAVVVVVMWSLVSAATVPIRQAFLNHHIPSAERATVLSFDSLLGSSGGIAIQPALGRVADAWSYAASYLVSGAIQVLAVPFLLLARRAAPGPEPEPQPEPDIDPRRIGNP